MQKFIISQELLQELANYLASRPWSEVNNMLVALSKLERIENKGVDFPPKPKEDA